MATRKNVMIVEDEAITAMYLQKEISGMGLNVCCVADTGRKAIDYASSNQVDVILMDIRLKDNIDGINAAMIINNNIPVIFHTAFADEETMARASQTRPVAILEKPASLAQIRESISRALKKN
ncbi:response regulator receiver protein [Desulfovibrio sp. X2]|uniref:response regulator n=1 Tax=Desulfovibrio sp. X2 TaxID=941449 RepID=UPI0003588914|nr:response regulator [Desulfovibrio sp. X2]EPR37266.1 response regulator receiver protein [Desulfovibrio sp. X2]